MTVDGRHLGEHLGLPFYTLGQRGGIGVGGQRDGSGEAWYVVAKRVSDNTLLVAQGSTHPALFSRQLVAGPVNWLCDAPPPLDAHTTVRLRYRQPDQPARVELREDGFLEITPQEAQRAVTPGQSAVIYQGTRCLGGGVIRQTAL